MWPILVLSILGLAILVWNAFEFMAGRRKAKGLVVDLLESILVLPSYFLFQHLRPLAD